MAISRWFRMAGVWLVFSSGWLLPHAQGTMTGMASAGEIVAVPPPPPPPPMLVPGAERASHVPYSMVEVTTRVQNLADGTRVTSSTETHTAMDAEGRRRTETVRSGRDAVVLAPAITIFDPVARENIMLYPQQRIARINHQRDPVAVAATSPRAKAEMTPEQLANQEQERAFQDALHEEPVLKPAQVPRRSSRESLGTQMIAGEEAEGTRTTRVVPAGTEGNDRDIHVVNEVWVSTSTHRLLHSISDDPRTGHSETLVTEYSSAPPDPAMFQVPADYKVFDFKQ